MRVCHMHTVPGNLHTLPHNSTMRWGRLFSFLCLRRQRSSPRTHSYKAGIPVPNPGWSQKPLVSHSAAIPPCSSSTCPHGPTLPSPRPLWYFLAPPPSFRPFCVSTHTESSFRVTFLKNCFSVLLPYSSILGFLPRKVQISHVYLGKLSPVWTQMPF